MRDRLHISVLGELKVAHDGRSMPLPASKKTRALLGYLAVVGRPVTRANLCDMFWEGPDDPRANLRWSLHKIRKITNDDKWERLTADNSRVFLSPQTVDLDFRRVSQVRPIDIKGLDTPALESLIEANAGRFLADLPLPHCPKFEAWRLYHSAVVDRIRIRILGVLIERTPEQSERRLLYEYALQSLTSEDDAASRDSMHRVASPRGTQHIISSAGRTRPDDDLQDVNSYQHGADKADWDSTSDVNSKRSVQDVRFCRSRDGVRIAYAICGRGSPLMRAAHWMSHLNYDWESPVWQHWMRALSETTTLVRYDQRGNGLSDRDVNNLAFEAMVEDLESVVDAAQLDRFTLLGVSQSCAVSAAYAALHPERLTGLILYGGFVRGWRKRGSRHEIHAHEAMTTLIREGWAEDNAAFRQLFTTMFIPGASRDQTAWFNDLQRVTVSADMASRLHEAFGNIDVSRVLAQISAPTLVLHATDDAVVPFYAGREFATGIRGARFVELKSANHILLANEPAFIEFCSVVTRFVSETASQ